MNEKLQKRCEQLIISRDNLEKISKWEDAASLLACAAMYTAMDKEIDEEKLSECKEVLKKNASIFSDFRGHVELPLICHMSMQDDPKEYFEHVKEIYEILNEHKIFGSANRIMAAMNIADKAKKEDFRRYAEASKKIQERMKEKYKWSESDMYAPYTAMLALSDRDVEEITDTVGQSFEKLELPHTGKDIRHAIAYITAMTGGWDEEKEEAVKDYIKLMGFDKITFDLGMQRIMLGMLPLLKEEPGLIAEEIKEVSEFLKKQKGCGWAYMDDDVRGFVAMLMVMASHRDENNIPANVTVDVITNIVIQLELLLIFIISTSATIASASNN